jgi:hypothetical protein
MRRNVTVSLDEETARWVRVEAAKRDLSVSRFLAQILAERRERTEAYEAARSSWLSREPRPLRRPGKRLPSRDELHHRGGRRP